MRDAAFTSSSVKWGQYQVKLRLRVFFSFSFFLKPLERYPVHGKRLVTITYCYHFITAI